MMLLSILEIEIRSTLLYRLRGGRLFTKQAMFTYSSKSIQSGSGVDKSLVVGHRCGNWVGHSHPKPESARWRHQR